MRVGQNKRKVRDVVGVCPVRPDAELRVATFWVSDRFESLVGAS